MSSSRNALIRRFISMVCGIYYIIYNWGNRARNRALPSKQSFRWLQCRPIRRRARRRGAVRWCN